MDTRTTKRQLRQKMLACRASLQPKEIAQKSLAICSIIESLPIFQASRAIMLYLALPHEVQTDSLRIVAQHSGKQVAVPVIIQQRLQAVVLANPPGPFRPGRYGILEPMDIKNVIAVDQLDCIFVPGVAFDRQGGRLGFGGGYYDRFLCAVSPHAVLCGLAFTIQLVPQIPMQSHDIRMHLVVTEQGVFSCDLPPHSISGNPLKEPSGA